jgi:hypothetical protein
MGAAGFKLFSTSDKLYTVASSIWVAWIVYALPESAALPSV